MAAKNRRELAARLRAAANESREQGEEEGAVLLSAAADFLDPQGEAVARQVEQVGP